MDYVSVPKDLTKVITKVAFNLTKRPLIRFGSGAHNGAIGRPTAGTRQLRDGRQPRALPPGEPLGGYDGPRITSPSRL